jgi:AraC-like DNA-binding protein
MFLPLPDSLGCVRTLPGGTYGWHVHPFDEICLIADSPTTIGHAGVRAPASVNTLYLFQHGERHGFWNAARESPRLWVVHFHASDALSAALPALVSRDPLQRIWRLTAEQADTFKALHAKIAMERSAGQSGGEAAQSAWLQLLLIAIGRWASPEDRSPVTPKLIDADLQQMWQIIQDYTGEPAGLTAALKRQIANYDSLRHRFRDVVGDSPARLWSRQRLHQAKNLLLESSLSVKEIATRAGYARQHEFARAFKKQFNRSPTDYRHGTTAGDP